MADYVVRRRRLRYVQRLAPPLDMRVFMDRANPLEVLSADAIRNRYRFFPATIQFIVDRVSDHIERRTRRSQALPTLLAVLVSLHFFATNAHHAVTAALHGVSRVSVCRAVSSLCDAFAGMIPEFVNFPQGDDLRAVQRKFYAIAGFPNVVGAIDCTHIKIQGPTVNEEDYVNRKGYHSINVQMICSATFRFTNIVAKWPGSVHDSRTFRQSEICTLLDRGDIDGILLGDSGYPCKKYLMTPFLSVQNPAQERYNAALCRTRVLIEQSFGVLKRRFPCLSYGLRVKPEKCVKITGTCVALHNIGLDRNDIFERLCNEDQLQPDVAVYNGPGTGSHYRDFIVNAYFS